MHSNLLLRQLEQVGDALSHAILRLEQLRQAYSIHVGLVLVSSLVPLEGVQDVEGAMATGRACISPLVDIVEIQTQATSVRCGLHEV